MIIKKVYIISIILIFNFTNLVSREYKWDVPSNLLNINSAEDDYAPSWNIYNHKLYFNSEITGKSLFYISTLDSNSFSNPILLNSEINVKNNNQSYIIFQSKDTAYYSSFRLDENRSYLNLYKAIYKKNNWGSSILLDSLSGAFFCSHPTISPNGRILIFSTTRFSKNKDADLAIAYKNTDGTWGNVRLISEVSYPDLNTTGNEITPFLASDDTLYFASNGYHGTTDSADYDIFYSILENGVWQKPEPIAEINSTYDESDFIILPSGEAIFASNRPGGKGKMDLYISKKVYLDNLNSNVPITDLNISTSNNYLATRISYKYQYTQLIPFIICNDTNLINKNLYNSGLYFRENMINTSQDSIYKYSLKIIAQRMERNQSSNLILSYYKEDSLTLYNTIEKIKYFLIQNYNILENQISINSINKDKNNTSLEKIIWFDSDDSKLFEPLRLIKIIDNIAVEPSSMDIIIDATQRDAIKSSKLYINSCGIIIDSLETNIIPKTFTLNLNNYSKHLINCDSLLFELKSIDKQNRSINVSKTIQISMPETRDEYLDTLNGKKFIVFSVVQSDSVSFISNKLYISYMNLILESIKNSKKVIIQYDKEKGKEIFASEIANNFIKKFSINKNKFELKAENLTKEINKDLIKYYVRILIEK